MEGMCKFRIGQLLTSIDCIEYTDGGNMDTQQTNLLCQTDVQTVDIQNLVDISDVKIDTTMKKTDRIQNFIRDIKNPYCFRCQNTVVKVSFAAMADLSRNCFRIILVPCLVANNLKSLLLRLFLYMIEGKQCAFIFLGYSEFVFGKDE